MKLKLREFRKQKHLTQETVAKILNVGVSTYSGYEVERAEPNLATLCELADYYNISLDSLVGRQYQNDIGYLDSEQTLLVKIIKELNRDNLLILTGRAISMLESQQA